MTFLAAQVKYDTANGNRCPTNERFQLHALVGQHIPFNGTFGKELFPTVANHPSKVVGRHGLWVFARKVQWWGRVACHQNDTKKPRCG